MTDAERRLWLQVAAFLRMVGDGLLPPKAMQNEARELLDKVGEHLKGQQL